MPDVGERMQIYLAEALAEEGRLAVRRVRTAYGETSSTATRNYRMI